MKKGCSIQKKLQLFISGAPPKYTTPFGIKAAKLKDLKSLSQKGTLPQYACDFYNSLVADDNVERDNPEDYDDD
ncbi:hypothetical protein PoB_005269900 [Plakobranchus ocellatus]|uniref:Uncharacterized protein n=1 Tax=Plakobranchus ocellatus TaxID=259542 RepID=A0AAV4C116_9GAST|nr:hypothetical protein PoB_005269900 [Plakobranchus ocellatus]